MDHQTTVLGALGTFVVGVVLGVFGTLLFTGKDGAAEEASVTIDQIKEIARLATIDYHGSVTEHVTERHA